MSQYKAQLYLDLLLIFRKQTYWFDLICYIWLLWMRLCVTLRYYSLYIIVVNTKPSHCYIHYISPKEHCKALTYPFILLLVLFHRVTFLPQLIKNCQNCRSSIQHKKNKIHWTRNTAQRVELQSFNNVAVLSLFFPCFLSSQI